jgi:hypothetical protein
VIPSTTARYFTLNIPRPAVGLGRDRGVIPRRCRDPSVRHKRASGACSLRASALIEAVSSPRGASMPVPRWRRSHRPPNRALLLSPRPERVQPGLGTIAFVLAPARAGLSQWRHPSRRRRWFRARHSGRQRQSGRAALHMQLNDSAPRYACPAFGEEQGRSDLSRETCRRRKAGPRVVRPPALARTRDEWKAGRSARRPSRRPVRRRAELRDWRRARRAPHWRLSPADRRKRGGDGMQNSRSA